MNQNCFVSACFVSKSYTVRHLLGYDHGLILVVVFLLNVWRLALQITFDFGVSTDRIRLLLMRQHSFGMPSFPSCALLWIELDPEKTFLVYQAQIKKTESRRLETNPAIWSNSTWPHFEKKKILSSFTTSARNARSFNQVGSNLIRSLFDHERLYLGSKS